MECKNCGSDLADISKFCTKCGTSITQQDQPVDAQPANPYISGMSSNHLVNHARNANSVIKRNFEWKEQYTYVVIVVAIVLAATIGFIFKEHKSAEKQIASTEVANQPYANNDKDNKQGDQSASRTEEYAEEENVANEDHTLLVISASASSELPASKVSNYNAQKVIDGNMNTCWAENQSGVASSGNGVGEWLQLEVNSSISGITIVNGYCKSQALYYANNRIKSIYVEFDDGYRLPIEVMDSFGEVQRIDFGRIINSTKVRVVISKVYSGKKYNDTCISEIGFY